MTQNRHPACLTRRTILSRAAFAAAAGIGWSPLPTFSADAPAPRRRALRLAHLTDVHVQPELGAGEGLAACLRHAQSLEDPPQLLLTGGDGVMDVFGADAPRAKVLADLWRRVWKAECSLPVEHCVGNHDIWGWDRKESGTAGNEPLWGKKWALDLYGLSRPYRSFDRAGWHFIVLDSMTPAADGYVGKLDDAQFAWLAADLRAVPPTTPVLVLSHIPILSIAAMMYGDQEKTGQWVVPASWVHIDARRIKDLFRQYRNVKLCLGGHIHLCDRVEYEGVTYACGGAVCADWWKGNLDGTEEGYTVVDLYTDGAFDIQYVPYGWTPRE
jgi:3',5'-cyclic AMP phosphodiesterase CpdA